MFVYWLLIFQEAKIWPILPDVQHDLTWVKGLKMCITTILIVTAWTDLMLDVVKLSLNLPETIKYFTEKAPPPLPPKDFKMPLVETLSSASRGVLHLSDVIASWWWHVVLGGCGCDPSSCVRAVGTRWESKDTSEKKEKKKETADFAFVLFFPNGA